MTNQHKKEDQQRCTQYVAAELTRLIQAAPTFPSNVHMKMYYDRLLPKHLLDKYDLNCIRYPAWQQAVLKLALASLERQKASGQLNDDPTENSDEETNR